MKHATMTLCLAGALLCSATAMAQDDDFDFGDSTADDTADTEAEAEAADTTDQGADSAATNDATDSGVDSGDDTTAPDDPQPEETVKETKGAPVSDRIKAVSRKKFLKKNRFELSPSIGLSVNDAFFRNYFMQVDATYHVVESFALELRFGWGAWGEDLEPYEFLSMEKKTITGKIRPAYLADFSGKFTPLYGKVALFSDWIWHYDVYVAAGIGLTGLGVISDFTNSLLSVEHQPTMNFGGGLRSFVNRWLVVHVDIRDYVFPTVSDSLSNNYNLMVISIGAGFYFPFDFEYEFDGYKVVS